MPAIKNVLITGASGFLGRHLVAEAKARGLSVFAPMRAEFELESGAGVADYFSARASAGEKIDAVIHAAAYHGGLAFVSRYPFAAAVRNLAMTATIYRHATQAGVSKIISVGSGSAYPDMPGDKAERDIFNGRCHESVEGYSFGKRALLVLQTAAYREHGIAGYQVIPCNLYGEYDVFSPERSHVVAALIRKAAEAKQNGGRMTVWGSGKPVRQLDYAGDAAHLIIRALNFAHDDEPLNMGGEAISIRDLANQIADIIQLPRKRIDWDDNKPDGEMRKVLNSEKLHALLPDFSPLPFAEGIARTVHWYLQNKEEADRRQ